jgi:hypothetical protein
MSPEPLLRPVGQEEQRLRVNRAIWLAVLPCLVVWAAISVAVYPYLPPRPNGEPNTARIMAGVIGMIGGFGLHRFFSMVFGHGRGPRSRKALLARAHSNAAPEDGQMIIATGVVRCDRPLISPLGGVPCAAYDYRMFVRSMEGTTKVRDRPIYWGYAAQPFSIESPTRSYPIPDVTLIGDRPLLLDGPEVSLRARNYFRSTGWETVDFPKLDVQDPHFHRFVDTSTTGSRRDFGLDNDVAPDVMTLRYDERVIPIGATVSAIGQWSTARSAMVRWRDSSVGLIEVFEGGPEALDGHLDMPEATSQSLASAIISFVFAAGAFYLARLILPNLKN